MIFSDTEKQHLLKAWIAISLAFAILMDSIFSTEFIFYFVISLITVGIGFLFHELAHKFVAQRYGCWAEFRADDKMLVFAVISAFLGFIFAAPGAVFIMGRVSKEKNGKISAAGPAANIILAFAFLGLLYLFPRAGILSASLSYGFQINGFIALFNMIPFMNFDGKKIWEWSKPAYIVIAAVSASFLMFPRLS